MDYFGTRHDLALDSYSVTTDYHDPDLEPEYLEWDDEDDFVTVRSTKFRLIRAVVAIVILVVVGWVIYSGARSWFESQLNPDGPPGEEMTLVVPSGSSTDDIARLLEEKNIVPNSTFFRYYAQSKGETGFQAGEYSVPSNISADEAIEALKAGPIPPKFQSFGVPEGLWLSEMLPRIAEQLDNVTVEELQEVLDSGTVTPRYRPEDADSWEGFLFPSRYEIDDEAGALEVLSKMNNEFAQLTSQLGYGAAESRVGRTAYEVLIVASLVEAEAKVDEDRAKIARVIYNRLNEDSPIGIDATFIYEAQDRKVQLVTELLETDSPYNSRTRKGLPPTPISAPGKASLEAAINPEEGPWMFYAATETDGRHTFSETLDEHNQAVQVCREKELGC